MPTLNDGDVPFMLNGEERVLRPTLRPMALLSKQFGGLAKVRQNLVAEDLDTVVSVIRYGENLSDRDAKGLDEAVFKNGLTAELLVALIKYVGILSNGGRPFPDTPTDKDPALAAGNA